jgi:hypothetical protein
MTKAFEYVKYECMVVNGSIPNVYFDDKNCSELMALDKVNG